MSWKRAAAVTVCLLACAPGLRAGQVELISQVEQSLSSDTEAMDSNSVYSEAVSVSADGRWVAFTSRGQHLLPWQVNPPLDPSAYWGLYHVFLHDRQTGETVLVDHAYAAPATTANSASGWPQISADGRWVLYSSSATNLLQAFFDASPNAVGYGGVNLFLYDRLSGLSQLVDHTPDSLIRTGGSYTLGAVMTPDGAWIAFTSASADLVSGQADTNGTDDVFLYERATGAITLVSRRAGAPLATGNGGAYVTAINDDGGSVAFQSSATNLVSGQADTNGAEDVFVWTRPTGATDLVSHVPNLPHQAANGPSRRARLSQNAQFVVFESSATNLGGTIIDGGTNVFLHDRVTGLTTLVSHAAGLPGQPGDQFSGSPRIDDAGDFIAFESFSSNLVPGQTAKSNPEIFLYNRATNQNTLVSHVSGSPATGSGYLSSSTLQDLSADGRYVLFRSDSAALAAGQVDSAYPAETTDVFLYDRNTGDSTLVSHVAGAPATAGDGHASAADMSPDSAWIAFVSGSAGLDADARDFNHDYDAFLHERATGENRLVSRRDQTLMSQTPSGVSITSFAPQTSITPDGRWVAFLSSAPNLVPGQVDALDTSDVFLRDRTAGVTYLVSRAASTAATAGDRESLEPVVTPDGRYVAFASRASNLVDGQQEGAMADDWDLFLWDRFTGETVLVSHCALATTGAAADTVGSRFPTISDDGRFIAFQSDATDLVAGQTENNGWRKDVYLWDRDAAPENAVTLVSHVDTSPVTTGRYESGSPAISADGSFVAFASESSLLAGQNTFDSTVRVYLFTRSTGAVTLVAPGHEFSIAQTAPVFSQDGAWLAFASSADDLVPGQNPPGTSPNVFLWQRAGGAFTLVSRVAGTAATAAGSSFNADLSADGRYVAFQSFATNLVPGQVDEDFDSDLFLFDRVTGATVLVSRAAASPLQTADYHSFLPRISGDGRRVAFYSQASDVVPGQIGGDGIYVFDRATGTNALASRTMTSAVTTHSGGLPVISADGLTVAFYSTGDELVFNDFNQLPDVFAYTVATPGLAGQFYTLDAPCRLLDSRYTVAPLASSTRQTVTAHGWCLIPASATALAVNVTATQPSAQGHLTLHPGDLPAPGASTINFAAGQTRANNAIVPLATNGDGTLALTPFVLGAGTVHVIVDVTGYFE